MNTFKRILFFLHASNFIVAFAGAILCYGICQRFGIQLYEKYGVLTFSLIFSIYFFQRMVDHAGFSEQERNVWGNKTWLGIGMSSIFLIVGFLLSLSVLQSIAIQIGLIVVFSVVSAWYVIPIFGLKLREIAGLKLLLIAATWSYTCVVFPYLNQFKEFTGELYYCSLLLLLYIAAVVLPFDIRDKTIDLVKQSTLPQLIGIRLTKVIGIIMLLSFAVGMYCTKIIEPTNFLFAGSVLIQMVLLYFTTEQRPFYYFLLIDFCIIFLGLSFFN